MQTENELMETDQILQKVKDTESKLEKSIIFLLTPKASVAYLYDSFSLSDGLKHMRTHGYSAMPVITSNGTYAGTVSEGDFLWYLIDNNDSLDNHTLNDIIRKGWNPAVKIDTSLDDVLLRVMEQNFIPVIDDRKKFMGIITRKDVIKFFLS